MPKKPWDETKIYDFIFTEKTNVQHSSGFCYIHIIGCNLNDEGKVSELESAGNCDHIQWSMEKDVVGKMVAPYFGLFMLNNDMLFNHRIIRFYHHACRMEVGPSLSTSMIKLVPIIKQIPEKISCQLLDFTLAP